MQRPPAPSRSDRLLGHWKEPLALQCAGRDFHLGARGPRRRRLVPAQAELGGPGLAPPRPPAPPRRKLTVCGLAGACGGGKGRRKELRKVGPGGPEGGKEGVEAKGRVCWRAKQLKCGARPGAQVAADARPTCPEPLAWAVPSGDSSSGGGGCGPGARLREGWWLLGSSQHSRYRLRPGRGRRESELRAGHAATAPSPQPPRPGPRRARRPPCRGRPRPCTPASSGSARSCRASQVSRAASGAQRNLVAHAAAGAAAGGVACGGGRLGTLQVASRRGPAAAGHFRSACATASPPPAGLSRSPVPSRAEEEPSLPV
jgi:hypothetical protein